MGVILAVLSLAGCISWAFAKSPFNDMPQGEYKLDLSHASIVWRVSHLGLSDYVARFTEFDASIDYRPNNIEKSSVTASINPMSIQTAYPNAAKKDFNKELAMDKGWFNAGEFASITFTSTSLNMTAEKTAIMKGKLTFLGLTKEIVLDVTFNGAMTRQPFSGKPTMGFSASTNLMRSEFGMSKYVPNIGDSVEVLIEGEFAYAGE
ncbi:MAG: polyisoprenoid-binding protein YceI [Cellvibrionaceae bacterium]|jgi:polyisoprenoid-binding protein YceI